MMVSEVLPEEGSYTADKRNPESLADRVAADAAIEFEHLLGSSTDGSWSVSPIIGVSESTGCLTTTAIIAIDMAQPCEDMAEYKRRVLKGIVALAQNMLDNLSGKE